MNTKDLIRLGVPVEEPIQLAYEFIQNCGPAILSSRGRKGAKITNQ
jgi:hypothetical protein